jgi:amino acid adenylation domain-containing protein
MDVQKGNRMIEKEIISFDYTREQIVRAAPPLASPAEEACAANRSSPRAIVTRRLPASIEMRLLKQNGEVPILVVLLTAISVLLYRMTGQHNLQVGILPQKRANGISASSSENRVALHIDISGPPTVQELVQRIQQVMQKADEQQEPHFEHFYQVSQLESDLSRFPLMQVLVQLNTLYKRAPVITNLEIEVPQEKSQTPQFDLTFTVLQQEGSLQLMVEYDAEMFAEEHMSRLLRRYEVVLGSLIRRPQESVDRLRWFDKQEWEEVVYTWNATDCPYPEQWSMAELIEQQAREHPQKVALVEGTRSMTYGELEKQANGVARKLRRLGVGPESLVAVCLPRSLDLVVSLLGVWKAGGGYVPLDPAYPQERLKYMLEETKALAVLTRRDLHDRIPAFAGHILLFEDIWLNIAEDEIDEGEIRKSENRGQYLAYVIYTSGSTGRPKGVQVTHRNIARLLFGATYAQLGPQEVFLQTASVSFDVSIFDIWGALVHGSKCVLLDEQVPTARYIGSLIRKEGITIMWLTASLFNVIVDEAVEELEGVKQLLVGGEALSAKHIRKAQEALPTCQLINGYGPTETTTFAACYSIPRPLPRQWNSIPIGFAIGNTHIYVLDEQGMPVPVGVPGEIYIGGAGVARGYLGHPELTAERFVPDPFSQQGGERLYRTGDLGCYQEDGRIEFLGRRDEQVKVRGFRIELGEIEETLRKQKEIQQAVVVVQGEGEHKRLVAYIVVADPSLMTEDEVKQRLAAWLPPYMIPTRVIALTTLPLTPNGKVDRQQLMLRSLEAGVRDYVEPQTDLEKSIADIWREVLDVEQVGLTDNFFALGGHSLSATRVVSRLYETFGVDVSLQAFFTRPTISALAREVTSTAHMRNALDTPLQPVPRSAVIPLSFAQQRLWFLSQLEPDSAAYNVPLVIRLRGQLDYTLLQASLTGVVQRHEVLRTTFALNEDCPVQVIAPHLEVKIVVEDLRAEPLSEREEQAQRYIEEELSRPFDLCSGPLLRACLLRLDEEEHLFLLVLHHIITDGWSQGLLLEDLARAYRRAAQGQPIFLEPLSIQYADYAVWQRRWLEGERLGVQERYWKQKLQGAPTILELPTEWPRPTVQRHHGAVLHYQLPTGLVEVIKEWSQQQAVTLFMTLLTGFIIVIQHMSRQQEMLIGTAIAGRRRRELESLIGFFVNLLALRIDTSGMPTGQELVQRVRQVTVEAYEHQDMPFERVVEILEIERDLSRNPLVQVVFLLDNMPRPRLELPSLDIIVQEVPDLTAKFDLVLRAAVQEEECQLTLEYDAALFSEQNMQRLLRRYEVTLRNLVEHPLEPVDRLSWFDEQEWEEVVCAWNMRACPYPAQNTIAELIEQQAAQHPPRVALVEGARHLSYQGLEEYAGRLAQRLRGLGVGQESLVGVCLPRCLELVVGLLAIWKAGGAYVPLDPGYPPERLQYMLEESATRVILTQSKLVERVGNYRGQVVLLESLEELVSQTEQEKIPASEEAEQARHYSAEQLAYVMYTSGSTGRPKGVQVTHRNIARLLFGNSYAQLGPQETLLHMAPIAFDASTFELWGALVHGSKCVLLSEQIPTAQQIGALIRQEQISTLWLTAALFNVLVDEAVGELAGVKQLLVGGEALSVQHIRKAQEALPSCQLINGYGPTETTTFALCYPIPRPVPADWHSIPIGRPIANTHAYLLDEHGAPVPIGIPGEIYIGGPGVARGYLGQPSLTAERFVPDPFSQQGGERLYRTGDLGRYLSDGRIEFLGRLDHQIKIRGFRIEPGEIEETLRKQEGVEEAVVVVKGKGAEKYLVAYIVTAQHCQVEERDILQRLAAWLPAYMIPARVIPLPELPLTPSGKVDRAQLAQDEVVEREREYVEPGTPIEQTIARIWREVLGIAQVGLTDNFFAVGGHSLAAIQVIARLRETFGQELPLQTLFTSPYVSSLARIIDEGRQSISEETQRILPGPRLESAPLSLEQQRLWFLCQLDPGNPIKITPLLLRLSGPLQPEILKQAIQAIVERHEILRTTFPLKRGGVVQVVMPKLEIPLPVVHFDQLATEERETEALRFVQQQIVKPFDLVRGPLLRTYLLRLDEQEHLLLVVMHHIITDGWSLGLFFNELVTCYQIFSGEQGRVLPTLPIQYADYATWQQQWLRGAVMDEHLSYWTRQLAGISPTIVPLDKPEPARRHYRGAIVRSTVPKKVYFSLQELARREHATLFSVTLAGFATLVVRRTREADILIAVPVARRTRTEIEHLIGLFADVLGIRINLSGSRNWGDVLHRVQKTVLDAFAHQEVPSIEIVRALRGKPHNQPLYRMVFTLNEFPISTCQIGPLTIDRAEFDDVVTFDLELHLEEKQDRMNAWLSYNRDLFFEQSIVDLMQDFQNVLEEMVTGVWHPLP